MLNDYVQRRKGRIAARRVELQQEFQHFRVLAKYAIMPYLGATEKRKSMDALVPDIYSEGIRHEPGLEEKAKRLKALAFKLGVLNQN